MARKITDLSDPNLFTSSRKKIADDCKPELMLSSKDEDIKAFIENNKLICVHGEFFKYEDGLYKQVGNDEFRKDVSEALHMEKFSKSRVDNVIDGLKTNAQAEVTVDPMLLNMRNGVFNLKTRELSPHSPERVFLHQLPVEYAPDATAPQFEDFLMSSIPDETERAIMLEYFGYALTGDIQHHKALFLIGSGGNGKGVLLHIMRELFGDSNACSIDLAALGDSKKCYHLHGKKVNLCTEMSAQVSERAFLTYKQVTSFEPISIKRLYRDEFMYTPTCKMVFATNHDPKFPENNDAATRRFLPVHFPHHFTDVDPIHRRDPELIQKLLTELPGIFNLLLQGLDRLNEQGRFSQSDEHTASIQRHRIVSDPITAFLDDSTFEDNGGCIYWSEMKERFIKYCKSYDVEVPGEVSLSKTICRRASVKGRDDVKSNPKRIEGLRWKDEIS